MLINKRAKNVVIVLSGLLFALLFFACKNLNVTAFADTNNSQSQINEEVEEETPLEFSNADTQAGNGVVEPKDLIEYQLVDSLVKNSSGVWWSYGGAWSSSWETYNCYAYAIDETTDVLNNYLEHAPGFFSSAGSYYQGMPVEELAVIVEADLIYLGYEVGVYDEMPTYVEEGQTLICVRVSTEENLNGKTDYHFMRKNNIDGLWYHKPSTSAPLQYKYEPEYKDWTNETSKYGRERAGDIVYDSDVWYFTFENSIYTTSELSDNTIAITGLKSGVVITGEVDIPQTIAGKTVTAIGNYVFGGQAGITSVEIPTTVTSIGSFAFSGCSNLTEVTGLNSVETIGVSAFNGCSALEEIELPASLIAIGFNAFTYCNEMNVTVAPNNAGGEGAQTKGEPIALMPKREEITV